MEWINQNKEWFLSGAGLFVISSIVSFTSVLLTLWFKSRAENKKVKKLKVASGGTKFSIPSSNEHNGISQEHIKISYKGKEYEDLCIYTVQITNIGLPAIEAQRLHLVIPNDANVIETFASKSLDSIPLSKVEIEGEAKSEIIYTFERLEPDDVCTISYLIDIADVGSVICDPRGVDNIDYFRTEDIDKSEINRLVIYIATFIFAGVIPVIGKLIQALIIIATAPIVIELYRKNSQHIEKKGNNLNVFGDIKVDADGEVYINQTAK
ncbi:MAG: hypothetical protein Q3M30_00400 [Candidatus Electrothrix sp. Rat3]|nr:hypothetical protein [Candidatus Electrothrix rattekaaiensis]